MWGIGRNMGDLREFDELDRRIIEMMCNSSQGSYRQLAKQLGVHPTTLIQRVKNRKGIFEYVLGGCQDPRLLDIRIFDEATKRTVYKLQTAKAFEQGESNCPLCALGHSANRTKIWKPSEMDADHVTAWSKGGATDIKNCQMLCRTHNRAKGNR